MDPDSFKKNLLTQFGLILFLAVILSLIWKFRVESMVVPALAGTGSGSAVAAQWVGVWAIVTILFLAMLGPGWAIYRSIVRYISRVETELGKSTRCYQSIVEATNDLIFQIDRDGVIVYTNPAVKLLGYECDELVGKSIADIIHNENRHEILPRITTRRVGHRATFNCPVQLMTSDNSVLSNEIPAIEFVMDACGLWEEPDHVVQERGTSKQYLGTLCIARPVVDRALLAELEDQSASTS